MSDPPPLRNSDCENFQTLKRAVKNGDAALLSAIRKSDGKPVALVVAVMQEKGEYTVVPLAVMVEDNPFEDFEPPPAVVEKQ